MNMHRLVLSGSIAAALALAALPATAQDAVPVPAPEAVEADTVIYELRRAGGSPIYGVVVSETEDRVVFESIDGMRIELNRRFASLRPARGRVVSGEFWPEDRNSTRLFFAPTGRTLEAGQGYGGVFLVLPFVGYGATDDLTLAGGMPPVGDDASTTPLWLAPKLRIHDAPGTQISTGVFAMYTPAYPGSGHCDQYYCDPPRDGAWDAIAYTMGTFGGADDALHLGMGVAYVGEDKVVRIPMLVGGELRTSSRNKLITENWLIPGEGGAAMVGTRRIGRRWTTDLGWMFLFGNGSVPYFPILSFSYAFGAGR